MRSERHERCQQCALATAPRNGTAPGTERKHGGDAQYCGGCGLSLGAPRSEPVLQENRWVPAADELAVYLGAAVVLGDEPLRAVCRISGAEDTTLLGYCMGGAIALNVARQGEDEDFGRLLRRQILARAGAKLLDRIAPLLDERADHLLRLRLVERPAGEAQRRRADRDPEQGERLHADAEAFAAFAEQRIRRHPDIVVFEPGERVGRHHFDTLLDAEARRIGGDDEGG